MVDHLPQELKLEIKGLFYCHDCNQIVRNVAETIKFHQKHKSENYLNHLKTIERNIKSLENKIHQDDSTILQENIRQHIKKREEAA